MRARLLLLAAALAAFGGSLLAGFHVDDYAILSPALQKLWRDPNALTTLSFWLTAQVAGQEPLLDHLVNLLLHLGAVLLAFECFRRLLPATTAAIAAGIFALHPLQSAAVNDVAARGILLAAVLCFAALWAWIDGRYWLAVLAFAFALLCDRQCALFPVVFLVARRENRWQIPAAVAFVLAILGALRPPHGAYAYALVVWRFTRLFFVPWGFTIVPEVKEPVWLAITAALMVATLAVWQWKHLAWPLVGLVLLIPTFAANPAFDSRAYIAMFAFAAATALLLARIPSREAAIAVVTILAAISLSRTYVWMSDERLWREAMRRSPDAVEPKVQLAKYLKASEALEVLGRARQQAPYNSEIPAEAGQILLDERQYDGALDELSRAIALNPKNALAFNNRGVALAALGQAPAAAADFEHALSIDPNFAEARENLKRLDIR